MSDLDKIKQRLREIQDGTISIHENNNEWLIESVEAMAAAHDRIWKEGGLDEFAFKEANEALAKVAEGCGE